MNLVSATRQYRIQQTASMIKACHDSGLLVKDWLQENDISKDTYYYWKRNLKNICLDEICPSFVEVSPAQELLDAPAAKTTEISAAIPIGATKVEIYSSASAEFLENLLKAVSHAE